MSIIIKGMEMPRGCAFCKIARRNGKKMVCPFSGEEWDIHDPMSSDFRLVSCPLTPVPPHGRLGDLDALHKLFLEKAKEYKGVGGAMVAMAALCIANAPTIIPAEEGEL